MNGTQKNTEEEESWTLHDSAIYIQTWCVFLWQKPMTDLEGDGKCVRSMTGLSSHRPSQQMMHKTEIPERSRSMLPRNAEVNAEEKAKSSVVWGSGRESGETYIYYNDYTRVTVFPKV